MTELENRLGYTFNNKELLTTAMTHSSYANEIRKGSVCNERLEFLGDAVLGLIVARHLYVTSSYPEGKMTRLRADLVCEKSLCTVAESLNLGKYLRLGRGEEIGGGRRRPSILADAVEATLAAIYLDGGIECAERFVKKFIIDAFDVSILEAAGDPKSDLQELVQKDGKSSLNYVLTDERGPDHAKEFTVSVYLGDDMIGSGSGKTKKAAEQSAARAALKKLS